MSERIGAMVKNRILSPNSPFAIFIPQSSSHPHPHPHPHGHPHPPNSAPAPSSSQQASHPPPPPPSTLRKSTDILSESAPPPPPPKADVGDNSRKRKEREFDNTKVEESSDSKRRKVENPKGEISSEASPSKPPPPKEDAMDIDEPAPASKKEEKSDSSADVPTLSMSDGVDLLDNWNAGLDTASSTPDAGSTGGDATVLQSFASFSTVLRKLKASSSLLYGTSSIDSVAADAETIDRALQVLQELVDLLLSQEWGKDVIAEVASALVDMLSHELTFNVGVKLLESNRNNSSPLISALMGHYIQTASPTLRSLVVFMHVQTKESIGWRLLTAIIAHHHMYVPDIATIKMDEAQRCQYFMTALITAEKARKIQDPFQRYFEFAEEVTKTKTEANKDSDEDDYDVEDPIMRQLLRDVERSQAASLALCSHILPLLFKYLPSLSVGNKHLIKLMCTAIYPDQLALLTTRLALEEFEVTGQDALPTLLTVSLNWDSNMQHCFWRIVEAEYSHNDEAVTTILPPFILAAINSGRFSGESLFGSLQLLATVQCTKSLLKSLLKLPLSASPLICALLVRWMNTSGLEEGVVKAISGLLAGLAVAKNDSDTILQVLRHISILYLHFSHAIFDSDGLSVIWNDHRVLKHLTALLTRDPEFSERHPELHRLKEAVLEANSNENRKVANPHEGSDEEDNDKDEKSASSSESDDEDEKETQKNDRPDTDFAPAKRGGGSGRGRGGRGRGRGGRGRGKK